MKKVQKTSIKLCLGLSFPNRDATCAKIDPQIRRDCGEEANDGKGMVHKTGCLSVGCCWDTSVKDSPWCYYVERPNLATNDDVITVNSKTFKSPIGKWTNIFNIAHCVCTTLCITLHMNSVGFQIL